MIATGLFIYFMLIIGSLRLKYIETRASAKIKTLSILSGTLINAFEIEERVVVTGSFINSIN